MDRTSERDFGFSKVEWRDANPDILEAVEGEYRRRLDAGARAWSDLDQKARFLFSGLIGLNTALAGWAFSHSTQMPAHLFWGIIALITIFAGAILTSALSLLPKGYKFDSGVTPHDLDVSRWDGLLSGESVDLRRFSGLRIKEYANAISLNERSNSHKSRWMKFSIKLLLIAFPSALIVSLVLRFVV